MGPQRLFLWHIRVLPATLSQPFVMSDAAKRPALRQHVSPTGHCHWLPPAKYPRCLPVGNRRAETTPRYASHVSTRPNARHDATSGSPQRIPATAQPRPTNPHNTLTRATFPTSFLSNPSGRSAITVDYRAFKAQNPSPTERFPPDQSRSQQVTEVSVLATTPNETKQTQRESTGDSAFVQPNRAGRQAMLKPHAAAQAVTTSLILLPSPLPLFLRSGIMAAESPTKGL